MNARIPRQGPRASVVGARAPGPVNRFGHVNLDRTAELELEYGEMDDGELEQGELEPWGEEGNPANPSSVDGQPFDPSVEGPNPQGRGDRTIIGQPNTVRWGDKARITFDVGPRSSQESLQLLELKLQRPVICSVRFTANVRFPGPLSQLIASTLDLYTGVGSSQQKITRTWLFQPNRLSDLDVTIPNLPVTTLLAQVRCVGTAVEGQLVVAYNLAVSPTVHT